MPTAGVEEIFLAEMTQFRADRFRNRQMVVDHESHVGSSRDRQKVDGQAADFFRRRTLGPQLDQVRAAIT